MDRASPTDKVLWTKGTLLSPQHLQMQDRRFEALLMRHASAVVPKAYGFTSIELDKEALSRGELALARATGIMPDGLTFAIPDEDPRPAGVLLDKDRLVTESGVFEVFLAIPKEGVEEGGSEVSEDHTSAEGPRPASERKRFRSEPVQVSDESRRDSRRRIRVARKNFRLAVEGELLDGHSVLPLARLRAVEGEGFKELDSYVPPVLTLRASPRLQAIPRRIVDRLTSRRLELSEGRRVLGGDVIAWGPSQTIDYWFQYTINSFLPLFRHITRSPSSHPNHLFETMLGLAGALTTFGGTWQPDAPPEYEHERLTECFGELEKALEELIETAIPPGFEALVFSKAPDVAYLQSVRLDEERFRDSRFVYLGVASSLTDEELRRLVPRRLKLGSPELVERAMRRGIDGIPIEPVERLPQALQIESGHRYFRLDTHDPEWDEVIAARQLNAFVPDSIPDASLQLVVIVPSGTSG